VNESLFYTLKLFGFYVAVEPVELPWISYGTESADILVFLPIAEEETEVLRFG